MEADMVCPKCGTEMRIVEVQWACPNCEYRRDLPIQPKPSYEELELENMELKKRVVALEDTLRCTTIEIKAS